MYGTWMPAKQTLRKKFHRSATNNNQNVDKTFAFLQGSCLLLQEIGKFVGKILQTM